MIQNPHSSFSPAIHGGFKIFIALLFISFFVNHQEIATIINAQGPTLRIMEYNVNNEQACLDSTNPNTNRDDASRLQKQRMDKLAEYIRSNSIDIVTLAEMKNWTFDNDGDLVFPNNIDDATYLKEKLVSIGHPMELIDTWQSLEKQMRVVTLTRYGSVPGTIERFEFPEVRGSNSRPSHYSQLDTPLGKIWYVSIHTHYNAAKEHLSFLKDYLINNATLKNDLSNVIVSGDFNKSAGGDPVREFLREFPTLLYGGSVDNVSAYKNSNFERVSERLTQDDPADNICGQGVDENHTILLGTISLKPGIQPPNPIPAPLLGSSQAGPTPTPQAGATITRTVSPTKPATPSPTVPQPTPNNIGRQYRGGDDAGNFQEGIYFAFFCIAYLTLIRFGFNIHNFFSIYVLVAIFAVGLAATLAFGIYAGIFVVVMGTFMVMM